MSNSPLVVFTRISPFKNARARNQAITKITPHHMAGNLTIESCAQVFQTPNRNASSNYGIGSDGRVGLYVDEKDRSWCSSSAANDNAALTIEVANNSGAPGWGISDAAWESLINLCVDMCRRNPGIKQKDGKPGLYCDDTPNASLTFHRYFSATGCAQPVIWNRRQELCAEVNKRLGTAATPTPAPTPPTTLSSVPYTVNFTSSRTYYAEPKDGARVAGTAAAGVYTITEERTVDGKLWGRLKSGAGWVILNVNAPAQPAKPPTIETPPKNPTDPAPVIWDFLKGKGLNDYAIAGLMGNLFAESGLSAINLQNSFEKSLGFNDVGYTVAVDSGAYTNFINDKAGYGLAQWTWWSRKENLLNFARAAQKSIGDLGMQLDFLWKEIQGYSGVMKVLNTATSVREASDVVLLEYEKPADQSEAVKVRRAGYGQGYFDKFAAKPAEPTRADYQAIIQARCNFSDPAGVWAAIETHRFADALYQRWADSYK